ncbi:hypothetical protein D3C83_129610 [compost metagenome]
MCGFSARYSRNLSYGMPADVIDVPVNSLATIGERGSRKSGRRSLAQNEWMSPPSTTTLGIARSAIVRRIEARSAG